MNVVIEETNKNIQNNIENSNKKIEEIIKEKEEANKTIHNKNKKTKIQRIKRKTPENK